MTCKVSEIGSAEIDFRAKEFSLTKSFSSFGVVSVRTFLISINGSVMHERVS